MIKQLFSVAGVPLLLGFIAAAPAEAVELAPDPHAPAPHAPAKVAAEASESGPQTIKGEVVKIDGRFYVVKDQQGKEIRLLVSKDTEMAGVFKSGDKIEVQTSPIEHAMSISTAGTQPREVGTTLQTVTGELVKIEGQHYIVKDHAGKELRLHVGEDTKVADSLKPGATIEALISPVEHAVFIKAGK